MTTAATAEENHRSTFAVDLQVGGHTIVGDEPADAGGADLGPAPYDLLTAALAECTAMTVRWYARRQNLPLTHVEVHVVHQAPQPGAAAATDSFHKTVVLHGDALTAAQRTKLVEVAAKCPVQKTLERAATVATVAADQLP